MTDPSAKSLPKKTCAHDHGVTSVVGRLVVVGCSGDPWSRPSAVDRVVVMAAALSEEGAPRTSFC